MIPFKMGYCGRDGERYYDAGDTLLISFKCRARTHKTGVRVVLMYDET
jgi:hypothetical protein